MGIVRSLFLAGSQSQWLKERAPRYSFVRRAVSRFMPGETVQEALDAALAMRNLSVGTIFTYLGENVTDASEADGVTKHYLGVIDRLRERGLETALSVKLTQLGLDLNKDLCYENLDRIITYAGGQRPVWIDMESSSYVDATLDLYRRARTSSPHVGVCLQAYLYRTASDLSSLMPLDPMIRLVKGAYNEPPERAFPRKQEVDENYFSLAARLLDRKTSSGGVRAAIATHDCKLIERLLAYATSHQLPKGSFEFEMLYGIQRTQQLRLAREGWKSVVLIAYGTQWFSWYMRRLAERPANAWFVARSLVSN